MEDRKNSSIGIGFHSYKPKSSEGIFPIEILSYENPIKLLQIKGGLSLSRQYSGLRDCIVRRERKSLLLGVGAESVRLLHVHD